MPAKYTQSELVRVFLKYGPNIRLCKRLCGGGEPEQGHEQNISRALQQLSRDADWLPDPNDLDASSALFSIIPKSNKPDSPAYPCPTSGYIAKRIAEHGIQVSTARLRKMYDALSGILVTRHIAQKLFEPLAFWMFYNWGGNFELTPLTLNGSSQAAANSSIPFHLENARDTGELMFTDAAQLLSLCKRFPGKILKPGQANFPTIDGLVYNNKDSTVYLLQMTIATSHDIKVKGLEAIYAEFARSGKKKKKNHHWKLVFVTEKPSKLSKASVKATTQEEEKKVPTWEARLSKYVLELSKADLYQLTHTLPV